MTHIAEKILSAITVKVTGLPTTGTNVARGRISSTNQPAALSVNLGQEQVINKGNNAFNEELLDVVISMQVEGPEGTTDTTLNQIAAEVYGAVIRDAPHGIREIIAIRYAGRSAPTRLNSQEPVVSTQEITFKVHYRHSLTDIESNG